MNWTLEWRCQRFKGKMHCLDATAGAVERRMNMNKVVEFIPEDDLCQFCRKRKATLLCDMPRGKIIAPYARNLGLENHIMTCDRRICTECTTRVNGFDFFLFCIEKIKTAQKGVKADGES